MTDFLSPILFLQRNSVVIMTIVFSLIVLWAYWPSQKKSLDEQGRIPMNDDR